MRIRVLDDIWSYIPKACNFPELPGNALAKISGMAYPKITLGLVCAFQSGNVLQIAKPAVLDSNNDKQ